jgi:hypothetical protein
VLRNALARTKVVEKRKKVWLSLKKRCMALLEVWKWGKMKRFRLNSGHKKKVGCVEAGLNENGWGGFCAHFKSILNMSVL